MVTDGSSVARDVLLRHLRAVVAEARAVDADDGQQHMPLDAGGSSASNRFRVVVVKKSVAGLRRVVVMPNVSMTASTPARWSASPSRLRHVDALAAGEGHRFVTASSQFSHHMTPDNAGCSGHRNTHVLILPHGTDLALCGPAGSLSRCACNM